MHCTRLQVSWNSERCTSCVLLREHSHIRTASSAAVLAKRRLFSERRCTARLVTGPLCPWRSNMGALAHFQDKIDTDIFHPSGGRKGLCISHTVSFAAIVQGSAGWSGDHLHTMIVLSAAPEARPLALPAWHQPMSVTCSRSPRLVQSMDDQRALNGIRTCS